MRLGIPTGSTMPPSCDTSEIELTFDDRDGHHEEGTYSIDRDDCLSQCEGVIASGYYPLRSGVRKCGYDFDGNADPNKAGEEEWALGFPKLITLFDRIFAHPYF